MMKAVVLIPLLTLMAVHSATARKHSHASPAVDAVKLELHNPSSATFENIRVHEGAVCGVVEAQKAERVYTGQMLFVYVGSQGKAYVLDPDLDSTRTNTALDAYPAEGDTP